MAFLKHPVLPGWVNVESFGAVHDGVTDDTAAINAAIASFGINQNIDPTTKKAGVVYCPRGHYRINGQLNTLPEGVQLVGEGSEILVPNFYGTVFETYHTDTVIYLGEHNDFNWNSGNHGIHNISFHCMVPAADPSFFQWEKDIIDAYNGSPIEITTASNHGFTTGDHVDISGVLGNISANCRYAPITVTALNKFTIDGSTGYDTYISGGVAFNREMFNRLAGAAIENRGGVNFKITYCSFTNYAIGILLDGAETGVIDRCAFNGTVDVGVGYQKAIQHGYNLWLTDGTTRGRGWTLGNSVNNHVIRDCLWGGCSIDCYIGGGTSILVSDGVWEGGQTAIQISGARQVVAKRNAMEGYTHEFVKIGPGNALQVTLENNSIDGGTAGIRLEAGVNQLNMFNNILGIDYLKTIDTASNTSPIVLSYLDDHLYKTGDQVIVSGVTGNTAANGTWSVTVISPYHLSLDGSTGNGIYTDGGSHVGKSVRTPQDSVINAYLISEVISLNNWNQHPGKLFDQTPGGFGIGIHNQGAQATVGVGINNAGVAQGALDILTVDPTYPIIRTGDSTYNRWNFHLPTQQSQFDIRKNVSNVTGNDFSRCIDYSAWTTISAGASTVNLCPVPVTAGTLYKFRFTVLQMVQSNPQDYSIWEMSEIVYNTGSITFGSPNVIETTASTQAGLTDPVLVDGGDGNIYVQVTAHASLITVVQAKVSVVSVGS